MPTGYEVGLYRDVERIRTAVERLADIETARYAREVLSLGDYANNEQKGRLEAALRRSEDRVIGVGR